VEKVEGQGAPDEGGDGEFLDARWLAGGVDLDEGDVAAVVVDEAVGLGRAGHDDPTAVGVGEPVVPMADGEVVESGAGGGVERDGEIVGMVLAVDCEGAVGDADLNGVGGQVGGEFDQL
jgi:hypothetical protein